MARIAGVDLPPNKRVEIALTYIYGIGRTQSAKILKEAAINFDTKVRELNDDEINKIRKLIEEQHEVEGDLRKDISFNIKRLMEIGSYRGLRHRRGLPVRRRGRPVQWRDDVHFLLLREARGMPQLRPGADLRRLWAKLPRHGDLYRL